MSNELLKLAKEFKGYVEVRIKSLDELLRLNIKNNKKNITLQKNHWAATLVRIDQVINDHEYSVMSTSDREAGLTGAKAPVVEDKNELTHFKCAECEVWREMDFEFAYCDDDEGICVHCSDRLEREGAEAEAEKWATYRSQQK